MRPDRAELIALGKVIAHDLQAMHRLDAELDRVAPSLRDAVPDGDRMNTAAYALHNLYNAMENTFSQVSHTFENHVKDRTQWHRELLMKMSFEMGDIRPALLSDDGRKVVSELLRFRHLYRHSYDFEFDARKLSDLVDLWRGKREHIYECFQRFQEWLRVSALPPT